MVKRLFYLLLTGIILFSLTACGPNKGQADTITNSSIFDPVDLSYENIAQLTDFKCYAAYQDTTTTVDGVRAKDLYHLLCGAIQGQEHTPTFSDGNSVYLVFYSSEAEYPLDKTNTRFLGTYTIYDDGLLVFSGSPFHSAAFDYKLESDIYHSVMDIILDDNELHSLK